ncbi:MAG: hypothetical protein IE911_14395 [Brevundimonas sp.]|nr:hypothetical protein [Brevundimonas sp.]
MAISTPPTGGIAGKGAARGEIFRLGFPAGAGAALGRHAGHGAALRHRRIDRQQGQDDDARDRQITQVH